MNVEAIIGTAIGTIVIGGAGLWSLAKFVLGDWKAWRERVEEKIDKLDPERIGDHFDRVHALSNKVFEVAINSDRHEKELEDHEGRIRSLEGGKP